MSEPTEVVNTTKNDGTTVEAKTGQPDSELGTKMKNLQFQEKRHRTPPPFIDTADEEVLALTPPRDGPVVDRHRASTPPATPETTGAEFPLPLGFKRVLSSPPTYDVSKPPPTRTDRRFAVDPLPSIPASPAPRHHHPHSTLTPVTRNTFHSGSATKTFGDERDDDPYVVSPEDNPDNNNNDNDFLSNLVMPDANHDAFDSAKDRPAKTLPDDIYLTSDDYGDDEVVGGGEFSPSPPPLRLSSSSRPTPSPRARSMGNVDLYDDRFALYRRTSDVGSRSPVPELPSSPVGSGCDDDDDLVNVSAPAEFFENTFLGATEHKRSPLRGHFRCPLQPDVHNAVPTTAPSLQYQPSRRDDSLTDVGVNRNAEELKSIFTTRASVSRKTPLSTTKTALTKLLSSLTDSIPVERQTSIPSIHLANRLGNDSQTASFTDGEYSWELDNDQDYAFGQDVLAIDGGVPFRISDTHVPLVLPVPLISVSTDADTNAAVGNVDEDDDSSRRNSSCPSSSDIPSVDEDEKHPHKVVVEVRRRPDRKTEALEWLQGVQCDSENRVGEAASSKFLTKGVTTTVGGGSNSNSKHVVGGSVVGSPYDRRHRGATAAGRGGSGGRKQPGSRFNLAGNKGIVPQSVDRGMVKRSLVYH